MTTQVCKLAFVDGLPEGRDVAPLDRTLRFVPRVSAGAESEVSQEPNPLVHPRFRFYIITALLDVPSIHRGGSAERFEVPDRK